MTDQLERRLHALRAKRVEDELTAIQGQRLIERGERAAERTVRQTILPLLEEFTASLERHGISPVPIVEMRTWKMGVGVGEPWGESFHWLNEHGWLLAEHESAANWESGSERLLDMLAVTIDHRVFRPFRLREIDKSAAPLRVRMSYLFRPLHALVSNGPLQTGHYADPRLRDRDHYATMLGWHLARR